MKEMVRAAGRSAEFEIASAGTSREEIGNDTHHGTKAKLREQGVPFTPRKARQITKADYAYYDYLICMDNANLRNLARIVGADAQGKIHLLLDFADGAGRNIADPWYTGNFDATYADVVEGCAALLNHCG